MIILMNNCIMAYVLMKVIYAKRTPFTLKSKVINCIESQSPTDQRRNWHTVYETKLLNAAETPHTVKKSEITPEGAAPY